MSAQHDLIIVGAGTAGSVLAERLTASGKLRVLLIEAGGRPTSRFVGIPAGFAKLFKGPHDWNFESEPQTAVRGRRVFTPRGKMLGGSSNMNGMVHQWCHPADFDGWAALGASGWSWTDVAPTFRAQERWMGPEDSARGTDGPMVVMPNRNTRLVSRLWVEAARQAGLGDQPYHNGHAFQGAWLTELAHKDGKRFSAYNAYLEPALRRANLQVLTDAHATAVVLDDGRASGVRYVRGGQEQTAAGRGVVLAAGAYGSPQLLMLSGIGRGAHLQTHGLPVRVDAPEVGENLQDHPVMPVVFGTSSADTLLGAESIGQLLRYLLAGSGMLASNGVEAFAFTQVGPRTVNAPDLELILLPFEVRREMLDPPRVHAFTIGVAVVAPRSRGRVQLRGPDPSVPPSIDPGLLNDPDGIDAAVLWEGVRLTRQIAATPPLAKWNQGELAPGAHVTSAADLLAYAATTLQTVYHPTSSCRMGDDRRAVVDSRLRVNGVGQLWVADASVMPTVPRGHPNAVVAMIACRAAAWIEESMNSRVSAVGR